MVGFNFSSSNITTSNWGTSRNIVITDADGTNTGAAVSVNGSSAISLKLPSVIKASITGNATTATTLATKRTINGTSFNGSANITTATWGTARSFTISDGTNNSSAVSVNGSSNVTLKLPTTIKAALSGNASSATKLNTARTITIGNKSNTFDGTKNITFSITDMGVAPASHGTHVSYGGNGSATTVSRSDHTHSYLPLSGGTMTGAITRNNAANSWVAAANGNSILYSSKSPGSFHPVVSAQTTNGRMVLAYYNAELNAAYLTKENCDANKNETSKIATLMNESGGAYWPGTIEASHMHITGSGPQLLLKATQTNNYATIQFLNTSGASMGFVGMSSVNGGLYRWKSDASVARAIIDEDSWSWALPFPASGSWWKGIMKVNGDGVMEAGKYLDFHNTNNTASDYSTRLQSQGDTGNTIYLPTSSGTISLDGHTHDDRYYTEGEVNNLVNNRVDWGSYNGFVGKFYMQDGRMLYMCSWDPGAIGAGNVWIQCG